MFAKLFNTAVHGQILVKIDQGEKCDAEVRFYYEPDDFGVCSLALKYDGDDAWDRAENAFNKVDEGMAIAMAEKIIDSLPAL